MNINKLKFLVPLLMIILITSGFSVSGNEEKDEPIIADILFTDESPYQNGDSVRVSVFVVNNLNEFVQIKIEYYIHGTDESNSHILKNGVFTDNPIHPFFVRTRSWGKIIPQNAPEGNYEWGGVLYYRSSSTGGNWVDATPENFFITFSVSS